MSVLTRLSAGLARLRQFRPFEAKSYVGATGVVALHGLEAARWSRRDYGVFARQGYMTNAVVYRSIRMVAEAAAAVPWRSVEHREGDEPDTLQTLLTTPSAGNCAADLLEAWYASLMISGNAYLHAVMLGGKPRELHVLRADRMAAVVGSDGHVVGFDYTVGSQRTRFEKGRQNDIAPVQHTALFHPLDDHYGLSPIEAAATAIDIHNAASQWNKALLDNSARPSGALVYGVGEGRLDDEQYTRLKEELDLSYQGARNAGRPLLLEGGLDWKSMGYSPRDMDFIEARNGAAREIALALGVPPMLLGIPGDNTYSNYQEANRSFWHQTVLPLVRRFGAAVSTWLGPAFDNHEPLEPDLDALPVFAADREGQWTRVSNAEFLSLNEKRRALGFPPVDGGDEINGLERDSEDAL